MPIAYHKNMNLTYFGGLACQSIYILCNSYPAISNNFAKCSEMADCWISGPSTVVALLRHLNAVLVQRRPAREPSILAYLIKVNYKCHQTMTVATWQMTMESTPSTPRPYQFESVIYNTRTSAEIMFHCWLSSGERRSRGGVACNLR